VIRSTFVVDEKARSPSRRQKWQDDRAEVTLYYHISAEIGGCYSFGVAFSPVVSV
jgi:hypothetical protein